MNYLELCNRVLRRLNEVELTSGTFSSSSLSPPQAFVKDAINDTLHDIYTKELEWPFNYNQGTITCVAGTSQYALSSVASTFAHIDKESFFLVKDIPTSVITARKLSYLEYQVWRDHQRELDENAEADERGKPEFIYLTQNEKIGVTPVPDLAYSITFDYWARFTELSAYSDIPSVPIRYHNTIVDGAMMYAYLYREDLQQADKQEARFKRGLQRMRIELIPQPKYLTRA